MADFEIKVDDREIKRFLKHAPKEINRAMSQALNKTMAKAATQASKDIRAEPDNAFTAKEVKGRFLVVKATWQKLRAVLFVRGGPKSRKSVYKGSTRPPKKTAAGVSFKPRNAPRRDVPGAFIATMKSGHTGVFKRRGATRLPIDESWYSSIRAMFSRKRLADARRRFAEKELPIQMQRAIKDRLRRMKW